MTHSHAACSLGTIYAKIIPNHHGDPSWFHHREFKLKWSETELGVQQH